MIEYHLHTIDSLSLESNGSKDWALGITRQGNALSYPIFRDMPCFIFKAIKILI